MPPHSPRPQHRGTAAHMAAQSDIGEERAPTPNSASGGRREEPSRGRLARSPRARSGSPGREGFKHFRRFLPPGIYFRVPCLGLQLYWWAFFPGMEHYYPPSPGDIFSYPRVFGLSGRVPDSLRTGQWLKPRLLFFFSGGRRSL